MQVLQIIVIIGVFLLIAFGLLKMQRRHVSFGKRVMLALAIGIIFGVVIQTIYGTEAYVVDNAMDWISIAADGFVALLQMLVIPLVFIAILRAFTNSKFTEGFGKIGGLSIGFLVGTVIIAGAIGVLSAGVFHLDGMELTETQEETEAIAGLEDQVSDVEDETIPSMITSMIPSNIFEDFSQSRDTSVISVVIFSIITGIAFLGVKRKQPEQAEKFAAGVEAIFSIVMRIVTLILRLTPYGILGLMTIKAATSELSTFLDLGIFIIASYAAILAMFIVHMVLIRFAGLNPITYIKKAMPPIIFGFSSRSSAGALPLTIESQKKSLGVPEGVADISGAFSVTIGQNGCAGIYPAMLAVMVAPSVGVNPFTPSFIFTLLIVVAIGSFGVAGVGGGATFASLIVLSVLNLPVAIVGLLISIEPLIDMARTALNISGGITTGVLTARVTKSLNKEVYDDQDSVLDSTEHNAIS